MIRAAASFKLGPQGVRPASCWKTAVNRSFTMQHAGWRPRRVDVRHRSSPSGSQP